jgi:hypothetical protein
VAYLYFYPLVTMDLSRKQSTNIEPGKEVSRGPVNMFVNVPEYPPVTMKTVVRPNYGTLYFVAWLGITNEPVIVSAPDTGRRYYMLPMLDMRTDVFACPGSHTTVRLRTASPWRKATSSSPRSFRGRKNVPNRKSKARKGRVIEAVYMTDSTGRFLCASC